MSLTTDNICLRYQRLKGEREGNWDVYVQECADFVLPRHNQIVQLQTPGTRRRLNIYDSTAIIANERLAAGLFSYLTPPNRRWFEFQSKDEDLREDEDVKRWFGEVTEITYQEIAKSNFSLEMHELYLTLGYAGTACIYLEEGEANALNFENIHYSQFVFERGEDGIADTVFREFQLTARKAVDKWGPERLTTKIVEASNDPKRMDNNFTFLHAVFPRKERDVTKLDNLNMSFASYYVVLDEKHQISEGGYDEMPFAVPRFIKDPKEKQGRSPAMSVLETIKLVNSMMLTIIRVTQKAADPAILVPSNDMMQNIDTNPGKVIPYKPNQFGAKPEPFFAGADIQIAIDVLDRERQVIKSAFYEDLFSMLITNQDKDKTATEVRELVDERETIFAPTWGRLQAELYNVKLTRAVGILMRKGMFPDVPEILRDADSPPDAVFPISFDIEYIGKLAIKVKSTELLAFFNTIELMTPLAEARPEILDWFKFDDIPKFTAERFGVPVKFIRQQEEVDKLRATRSEAQSQERKEEMALEVMKSADKVSGPVDPASIISQFTNTGVAG
jgi:hypothetical protein